MGKFATLFESIEYAHQKSKAAKASGKHFSKSLNDHMYMHRISQPGGERRQGIEQKIAKQHGEEALHHAKELTKAFASSGSDRQEKIKHHEEAAHEASKKFRTKNESVEGLDEALRKVGEHENGNRKATVHKDSEWGEYRVKFHTDGKHHADADYHTDDKEDANDTAKHWVSKHDQKNESYDYKLDEALRKIGQHAAGNRKATIHRDAEWGEYRVKHHTDDKYHGEESDYHTDDKEDAHNAAKHWVSQHGQKNESAEQVSEERESRREYDANDHLANTVHHVYVTSRGKKKSIAGPFRSKEEAESHPARKFGDGVATSDQLSH